MSKHAFHHILLIGRSGVSEVPETLLALRDYLQELDVAVSIEENTTDIAPKHQLPVVAEKDLPGDIDLVIVVGGDGSLLNAAHLAVEHGLPVLGINRGKLGFLTDIYPNELDKVGDVIHGNYQQENRFLLHASLQFEDKILYENIALNDVVLQQGKTAQLIEFETYINDVFVCRQRADGLIVATPTGSTAYSLSGGGPILHPQVDAVALVPMFPHTLSSRPIVIGSPCNIDIRINKSNDIKPNVSCDGQSRQAAPPGGHLKICKYDKTLKLIHPQDYGYFTTLREKLNWEQHLLNIGIRQ